MHVVLIKLARHKVTTLAREIKRTVLGSLTFRFPDEARLYAMKGEFDLKDPENGLARAESFQSDQERRNAPAHALAVAHTAAVEPGLKMEPVGEAGKADAQASATTMAEVATSNKVIRNRCTPGSNTSFPHGNDSSHNSRPHGSSSSSGGDIRSHNSGDCGICSSTPGPAGRDPLPNSNTGAESPTSGDNNIREEISRTGSGACVSGVARRSISPQSAGQIRSH